MHDRIFNFGVGVVWFQIYSNWVIVSFMVAVASHLLQESREWLWTWTCVVWIASQQLLYAFVVKPLAKKYTVPEDPHLGQYDIDGPFCVNRVDYDLLLGYVFPGLGPRIHSVVLPIPRILRFLLSVAGSCALLFAFTHVHSSLKHRLESSPEEVESLVFVILDGTWKIACFYLTFIEGHEFWTSFRSWESVKSYAFRVAMFHITTPERQYMNLLIVHASAGRVWNIVSPHLFRCFKKVKQYVMCQATPSGDLEIEDDRILRPLWSISQAHTDLAFTQFLVCMVISSRTNVLESLLCGLAASIVDQVTVHVKLKLGWVQASEKMKSSFLVPVLLMQGVNVATYLFVSFWLNRQG